MTISETLAYKSNGKFSVEAEKSIDKYGKSYYYRIYVCMESVCLFTIKTAKTTWKAKFIETCKEYNI